MRRLIFRPVEVRSSHSTTAEASRTINELPAPHEGCGPYRVQQSPVGAASAALRTRPAWALRLLWGFLPAGNPTATSLPLPHGPSDGGAGRRAHCGSGSSWTCEEHSYM